MPEMKHRSLSLFLFATFMILMTAIMIWQGIGITPDRYALGLLFFSFFIRRGREFLWDWSPFLFILLSYDFFRGLADQLAGRVHYFPQIFADVVVFGNLPTITLQQILYHPGNLQWYDYLSTVFYFLHFALPLGFGFLLWIKNKDQFRSFTSQLLVLSYMAFFTYLIFPAAPPWLASQQGYIPELTKIMNVTLQTFPEKLQLPTIYHNFNPNEVAAIPSLHASYPFLVLLFIWKYYKNRALLFVPYVLGVWFSIVYLGEHYVVDIIIGVIYVLVIHYHRWFKGNLKLSP